MKEQDGKAPAAEGFVRECDCGYWHAEASAVDRWALAAMLAEIIGELTDGFEMPPDGAGEAKH